MRTITILIIASALILSACATTSSPPQPARVSTKPAPVCTSDRQCEAMWLAAREAMMMVTRMRIRTETSNSMETFAPTTIGYMGGRAAKRPNPDGSYSIISGFDCGRSSWCGDLSADARDLFVDRVNAAGRPFASELTKPPAN